MKLIELIPFYGYEKKLKLSVSQPGLFTVTGAIQNILVPPPSKNPSRIDGLYKTTCFEVFAANEAGEYLEWNFSPSGNWCVFSFHSYRNRSKDRVGQESFSNLQFKATNTQMTLSVELKIDPIKEALQSKGPLKIGCTAVIEFLDNKIDYYALRHPSDKPDFHDIKGFLIEL